MIPDASLQLVLVILLFIYWKKLVFVYNWFVLWLLDLKLVQQVLLTLLGSRAPQLAS
jgi:hypothetical protein